MICKLLTQKSCATYKKAEVNAFSEIYLYIYNIDLHAIAPSIYLYIHITFAKYSFWIMDFVYHFDLILMNLRYFVCIRITIKYILFIK